MTLIIRNGKIYNAVQEEPFVADICVKDGKIEAIGTDLTSDDTEVLEIDAEGLEIYPGFVEAYGHIGLDSYGIGFEGQDYNEMGDILCVQLTVFVPAISHSMKRQRQALPVLQPVPAVQMFSAVLLLQSRQPDVAWKT